MLCMVPVSSCMRLYIRSMLATVLLNSSACSSICAEFSLLNFAVCRVPAFCAPIKNGIELCSIGAPRGRVIVCTRSIPRMCTMPLATLSMTSMSAGVRRSWSASSISSSGFMRAWEKCLSATSMARLAGISAGVNFWSLYCGTYVIRLTKPMIAIKLVNTMIGMGQRTTDVPTLRQPVVDSLPRGSRSPNLEATVNTAGANVSAAATITSTEIAHGSAMLWK
ncbi:Uncharacterised protein [Mycobacteroides abscessus]|nr:Uncharacterised protein [Mycobacteroides abscessus]